MPKLTRNTGTHWSKSGIQELRRLAIQNLPVRVIGLKLGRTESAIRNKAFRELISLASSSIAALDQNRTPRTVTAKTRFGGKTRQA